ncbi:MAG: hypothetical protein A2174_00555 [Candidatus Portnoybacteria bacterium RBG_13_41_18]|uniref:Uncharacterized protein n=1 Tax=Candidatus Portnoybacteria bacterium RBG_13_41_18 TaxID=1801991 RepID=A0A1G2FAN4_9BACT|nr:MAG: hypothetical protein A2174_00555 [Candidatus Portnoybacteria bacterium RBG_13_41_18]
MDNPEIKNNIINEQEGYKVVLDLLTQFEAVNENDVKNLREVVDSRCIEAFDKLSDEKKMIIALLHKLAEEKLRQVYEALKGAKDVSKTHYLGFHKLQGAFQFLMLNAKDSKYDFLKKTKEE